MVGGRGKSVMYVCVSFFSHPGSHTGLKNWAAEMDWGGQVCACVCLFPILALTLG